MKNICLIILLVALIGIGLNVYAVKQANTGGTIHFRGGHEVAFTEMGMSTSTLMYKVAGKLNAQDATYYFSELSEIRFLEADKAYYQSRADNARGSIRIVDRTGSAFILNDAYIAIGHLNAPEVGYKYLDPATKNYRWSSSKIANNISYIAFD